MMMGCSTALQPIINSYLISWPATVVLRLATSGPYAITETYNNEGI